MQVVQYLMLLLERIHCVFTVELRCQCMVTRNGCLLYVPCFLKTVESYLAYKSVLVLVSPV